MDAHCAAIKDGQGRCVKARVSREVRVRLHGCGENEWSRAISFLSFSRGWV